jgi:hypothetical protein
VIARYSIWIDPALPDFMDQVLREAAKNPKSFVIDDSSKLKTICFTFSSDAAQRYCAQAKQGHTLGDTVAYFTLTSNGISRDPESGSDEEFAQLAAMVRWLLATFPNYRVTDEENGKDVTDLVRADVDVLFLPDWKRQS